MNDIDKNTKAVNECYRLLYKHSTPPADFDQLLENSPTNDLGQKDIGFMSYKIDKDTYSEIVDKVIKKHNFTGVKKEQFKFTIAMGCSPKFKQ